MTIELEHRVIALETLASNLFVALNAVDREIGPAIIENFERVTNNPRLEALGELAVPTKQAHENLAEELRKLLPKD